MAVYKQSKSKYWWFKFVWNGKPIRESTKQTNRRVAEQMEAARLNAACEGRSPESVIRSRSNARGIRGGEVPAFRPRDIRG